MMKLAEALGLRRADSKRWNGLRQRNTDFEAHYLPDDEFAALGRALHDAEAEWPVAVASIRRVKCAQVQRVAKVDDVIR